MKVILLKDVSGVGQHDMIREVSDGYALNYLIPNGLAVQATLEKITALEKKVSESMRTSAERDTKRTAQIRASDKQKVVVRAKANAKGHLFKGLRTDDIAEAISHTFGDLITPDTIQDFSGVIREMGEHTIHLASAGAEATVIVVVEAAN